MGQTPVIMMDRNGTFNRTTSLAFWWLICCFHTLPASAQTSMQEGAVTDELDDEFALLAEEDVVYSASKHEQDISDSPSAITVITREQIENSPCVDIPCLLSQTPELDVRFLLPMMQSVGARAMASDASDRGLILVDGRDILYEELGSPFWGAIPIHLDDVERIEVIRGPASSLYGVNAHSMVVSIISRNAGKNQGEIMLGGGDPGVTNLHARVDQVFGSWRLQLTASRELADSWQTRDLNKKDIYRAGTKLEHSWNDAIAKVQVGFNTFDGNIFSSFAPIMLNNTYQGYAGLLFENKWLRTQLWIDTHHGDFHFDMPLYFRGIKLGSFPDHFTIDAITLDEDTQTTWSLGKDNILLAGVNYRFLGFFMDQNDPQESYQHRLGFYVQDEQRLWDRFLINGGVRLDYNNITPFTISPRLAASWRFLPGQVVRLAFGHAYRKPSFIQTSGHFAGVKGTAAFPELADFFRRSIGNKDVDNESITAFEVGYRGEFFKNKLTLEADAFFNLHRKGLGFSFDIATNELGFPDLQKSYVKADNTEDINSAGGSVSLTYKILHSLWLNLNYTFRYSAYAWKKGAAAGNKVPWEPSHLFNATGQYQFANGLRVGLALHAKSSADFELLADGQLWGDPFLQHNAAFVYINGMVAWRVMLEQQWLELGMRVFDLFDGGFVDTGSFTRFDGTDVGAERNGRRVFIYVSGGL